MSSIFRLLLGANSGEGSLSLSFTTPIIAICNPLLVTASGLGQDPDFASKFAPDFAASESQTFYFQHAHSKITTPYPLPPISTQFDPRSPNATQASAEGHSPKMAKRNGASRCVM